ncbi:ABC transporter permease [Pararhizobium sp. YC-54]|uniref:ABC transporter permease n=1 Tax=Pararhizobium sp. YC-54 TaxID=2986920 RepID=UPI0021F7A7CA|nr:ABC transporter permease [Pararhizobium sp. YC-54]MCV9999647.1 ABC transporter permease [Pararhizobium sp. YC-54]
MSTTTVSTGTSKRLTSRPQALRAYYPILAQFTAVIILIAFFAIQNPLFFSLTNFQNIGMQSSVLLLVALAGTLVIMIGSIDLSVGATVVLATLITAIAVDIYGSAGGIALAVLTGAIVGLVNGGLLVYLKVPSFLATLGMMSVLGGIAGHISGGIAIVYQNWGYTDLVNGSFLMGLPNVATVALLSAVVLAFVSLRTKFGRYLYAIGGGEVVASNSGVPINRFKIWAFVVCGALCGLAGALLAGQVGAGTPAAGSAILLNSIAAIVMGGTALSGGVGGPHRTILGVLLIAILSNGMDVTEVGGFTQEIVKGLVIIIAVALTTDRKKYQFIK